MSKSKRTGRDLFPDAESLNYSIRKSRDALRSGGPDSRFFYLLDELPALVYLQGPDHSIKYANRRFREQMGDFEGKKCYDFFSDGKATCEPCHAKEVFESGSPSKREWVSESGKCYEIYACSFRDADGCPLLLKLAIDVTGHKEMETLTNLFMSSAPVGLTILDEDCRYLKINDYLAFMHGKAPAEHIGKSIFEIIPALAPSIKKAVDKVIQTGEAVLHGEFTGQSGGLKRDVLVSYFPLFMGKAARAVGVFVLDITERKRVEQALMESEEKYRRIVDTAQEGIWGFDREMKTNFINHAMASMLGREVDEVLGRPYSDFTAEDRAAPMTGMERHKKGTRETFDARLIKKDGSEIWLRGSASPFFSESGEHEGRLCMFFDITDRKLAESALRESNELFEKIFSGIHLHIACLDRDFNFIRVNEAYARADGRPVDFFPGKNHFDLYPSDENRAVFVNTVETGQPFTTFEKAFESPGHPERGITYCDWSLMPVKGPDGVVNGLILSVLDVTDRKRAEELRVHRDNLEGLVEERTAELKMSNEQLSSEIALRIKTEQTLQERIKEINCLYSASNVLGRQDLSIDEMLQQLVEIVPFSFRFPEHACARIFFAGAEFKSPCYAESPVNCEAPITVLGREIGSVRIYYREEVKGLFPDPFVREERELLKAVSLRISEMVERKQAEEERARLVTAIESSADATFITDPDGMVQYVNPAFEKITGFDRKEVIGGPLDILSGGQQGPAGMWDTLKAGKTWSGNLENRKRDGTVYNEEVTVSPVRARTGDLMNLIVIKRDVTEKMRLESIAEAVNSMNNVGYIFSGIRHEIGNPVNSMKTTLSVLRNKLGECSRETVSTYIERMLAEITRLEYLLKALKSFNMYETPEIKLLQVNNFIKIFVSLISGDIEKKGIRLETSLEKDLEYIYADPRALQQVLLNVLTNAFDSLEGVHEPRIQIKVMRISPLAIIRISDNGCGMNEKETSELFRPFYTTKAHGTGLGLMITKKMLAKMNGHIEISSRKGEGTAVDIFIPEGSVDGD